MRKVTLFLLLLIYSTAYGQNLRTLNKDIVDENNNEVILRSAGLGGWMLQEPYMFNYSSGANTQHEFKEKLINLVGSENTELFFESWLDNFVTEQDVDSIASWGFNSIRLPMHYDLFTLSIQNEPVEGENTWLDRGFEIVDQLLDWCEQNELYLILDLHAAPGGQGYDAAISDYNSEFPSLWESVENQNKTIALWEQLAMRYKDEPWIGGYDLLNETNWDLANFELRSFYVQVTNAIREHDTNHIIFIEGNWFANDFTGLIPPWDDNMAYSFHKYWSYNNTESIQWVLDIRNQYNTPLWMGESGENSNLWFTDAIRLFEDNDIGWAWWPWKKTESINSTLSISSNSNFQSIINYFADGQNHPLFEEVIDKSTWSLITNQSINGNAWEGSTVSFWDDVVDTAETDADNSYFIIWRDQNGGTLNWPLDIVINLNKTIKIHRLKVWQRAYWYNGPSPVTAYYYQEENMKSFDLFASNNGQEWTLLGQYDIGDPRDADGNIPSAAMDAAANGHDFELEGISEQFNYLKISITSNYGSDTYCHGSEITLYGLDNL